MGISLSSEMVDDLMPLIEYLFISENIEIFNHKKRMAKLAIERSEQVWRMMHKAKKNDKK